MKTISYILGCWLLLAGFAMGAHAQSIPAKGTAATLDVATWNLEWFGSDGNGPSNEPLQQANIRAVIEQAEIDLWAVQEIANVSAFEQLLADLEGPYEGTLATLHSGQRVGFIYNTDVIRLRTVQHVLTAFSSEFASRPPLQMEADVVLPDTTVKVTFLTVHMKAFSDLSSYNRRVAAAGRLKNHIDFTALDRAAVIVLGDLNDKLLTSITAGQTSPYDKFVQDDADYLFATRVLEEAGVSTFLGSGGSTIDHILITDELMPHYDAAATNRYAELLTAISSYSFTTSDHLPVFARFRFDGRTTSSTPAATLPTASTLGVAYPHPFHTSTTIPYTLSRAGAVRLDVLDLLGRRVATLFDGVRPAGAHHAVFEASAQPAGLYLVRLTTEGAVTTRPVVKH